MNISNIGQSALKAWFGPGSTAATFFLSGGAVDWAGELLGVSGLSATPIGPPVHNPKPH